MKWISNVHLLGSLTIIETGKWGYSHSTISETFDNPEKNNCRKQNNYLVVILEVFGVDWKKVSSKG